MKERVGDGKLIIISITIIKSSLPCKMECLKPARIYVSVADCCYVIEDNDHVTSVTSFPINGGSDFLLLYGTVSGCVFGMSVNHRSKVFSIPCPHVDVSASAAVDAVTFLPSGQLLVAYRGWTGFTVMNFGIADPPDRPPTRCLKRDK